MAISPHWVKAQFPRLTRIAVLASGGQKEVFSAKHVQHGDVVLKLINLHQDAEILRREILAVMRVSSNRVPKILEEGQCQTPLGVCSWILEQRIHGEALRYRLPGRPLPPREILLLTYQMLQALADAEKVNIVHRDVKPDNIMRDDVGEFWLLDFGIARHLDLQSMTPTAHPFGKVTWGYAPPEQCRNFKADIDARVDLFALGITVHEMATGTNPFRENARDPLDVLQRVENMRLPDFPFPLNTAGEFRDLLSAMTQKRRDHRPLTAHEALEWCREFMVKEKML